MRKLASSLRVTELDTLLSTLLRLYAADEALCKDAFMASTMAELAPLSRQLTEAVKRERTGSLAEADRVRDAVILDLGTLAEGYTAIPFEAQKTAAFAVKAVFDKYGRRIVGESYATESSLIESLLIDLSAPELAGMIAQLPGIAELIAALRRAQDDFNVAKDQQTERAASDDAPSATSLRKNLIAKVNDRLIPYLNAMAIANEAVFGAFIKQVEVEIGRANDSVSRRKSAK